MKTMRATTKLDSTPSSKSHIPRPMSSTKKMKARPAPDFSKLHKKWEEQLERGKSTKKRPVTVAQPFDVTKPGTKFTVQEKTTVLNELDDFDVDFESDQKALDTILKNRGLSEKKVTGRTTIDALSMSTGKIKNRSCTNLGKRRILGELPCDPEQIQDRTVTAKKALAFDTAIGKEQDVEFEEDPEALVSILNDKGIAPVTKDSRQTFAACRPSLLHHPLPPRQSCISAQTKTPLTDTKTSVQKKDQDNSKSPFKSSSIIVHESPFGQKIMRSGRNSIYRDYQICPMSNPAIFGPKTLAIRDGQPHQLSSPVYRCGGSVRGQPDPLASPALPSESHKDTEKDKDDQHKSVKWADVLTSYSIYSPCAVPKIKEKRTLFTTIDETENDNDDCKENIEPAQEEIDKRGIINNSSDVTSLADGQSLADSSAVVSSMTHTKLLEPRHSLQQNVSGTVSCKVPSNVSSTYGRVDSPTPGKSTARRVPIAARHESNINLQNSVSVTKLDENRTVGENSQSLFHRSGISTLPKQGSTDNGKGVNLPQLHSNSNLGGLEVHRRHDNVQVNTFDVNSQYQKYTLDKEDMAMHTEEKDESEDSEKSQGGSNTQSTENRPSERPDNETVDRFVGRVKSRKRQSIVELNESIVESQAHMDHLREESDKLQDVKEAQEAEGTNINLNILQQIELIAKQQEMLTRLQEQLKQQLLQQQTTTPVAMVTTSVSHDSRSVLSAAESNNNGLNQRILQKQTISQGDLNVQSENLKNNNVPVTSIDDSQTRSVSIFASSTAAVSQTLSPSRSWSKNLTLTPSKHQSRVAIATDTTPFVTKTLPQTSGNISPAAIRGIQEQIKTPTPVKPETSRVTFSTGTPLWTPLAQKDVSFDQHGVTQNVCDNDIKTCTSQVAAIDLSVKRPIDDNHVDSVCEITAVSDRPVSTVPMPHQSAFVRVTSPSRHIGDSNMGSLSLLGNIASSPSDHSSKRKRLSLRRTVISVTDDLYQEALLDEECALYACRLQSIDTPGCAGHDCSNPVARMLVEGDSMHFIPIRDESPVRHFSRPGSAFSCYSPSHC